MKRTGIENMKTLLRVYLEGSRMLPAVSAHVILGKITNVTCCFCSRYTCTDHKCYLLFLLRVYL